MFSVVMPLYNKEAHVASTIESILGQRFRDFEIIVVDDGSEDDGLEIVKSFSDPRVRIYCQENSGVSSARNRGVREAQFDYVAFIDADDCWHPNFLNVISALIKDNQDCDIFGCGYKIVDSKGCVKKLVQLPEAHLKNGAVVKNYFKSLVDVDSFIWTSATCVRKSVFYDY